MVVTQYLEVEYLGKRYFWAENFGVVGVDFVAPPHTIRLVLERLLAPQIAARDAASVDFEEQLNSGKMAWSIGDFVRAQRLLERALKQRPRHEGAVAVLSAILRRRQLADEAVALTESFASSKNVELLTSRAAALVDLNRRDLARPVAERAWTLAHERGQPDLALRMLQRRLQAD